MWAQDADKDLWQKFIEGDDQAYSEMYDKYVHLLFRYGLKICPDDGLVEDCLHDFFVYIYTHRSSLSEVYSLKAYMLQSFRRMLLRQVNRDRNRLKREQDYGEKTDLLDFSMDSLMDSPHLSAAHRKLLIDSIESLPPRQKEIVYLKFFDNLTYSEIAEVTGVGYQTVVNHVNRSLKRLKKVIDILRPVVAGLLAVCLIW